MQADNTFDDQMGRELSVRGARVSPIRSPARYGSPAWSDQLTSAVRVEAIDLVDNIHSREGGVVGGGEQLLCRPGLAPLRYPKGQGVEHDDLDLVIAGEASLVDDGFEFSIVAVRHSGQQRSGQQGAVPASGAVPVVGPVQESLRRVLSPGRPHDPCEVDPGGRSHPGVAAPDGRLNREGQGLAAGYGPSSESAPS
jgi:hypothetical protein